MKRVLIDITGKRFGRWSVVRRGPDGQRRRTQWECRCDCGRVSIVRGESLKNGQSTSCGCWQREEMSRKSTTHGLHGIPEYKVWAEMIQRCENPKASFYSHYGARGIAVCPAWKKFETFIADMGFRPSPKHSIDRKDNSKGYAPDNCGWTTPSKQMQNSRVFTTNTSGVKGVSWMPKHHKYQAYITVDRKRIPLGSFADLVIAASARAAAERKYWGINHE